jgi:hypothetical protein
VWQPRCCAHLQGITWSTATVLSESVVKARALDLDVAPLDALPTLADIDTVGDLAAWCARATLGSGHSLLPTARHVLALAADTPAPDHCCRAK